MPDLRVAPFPADGAAPYLRLLHGALTERGVELVELDSVVQAAGAARVDVVHLHWLEYLVRGGRLRAGVRAARLSAALRRLRRAGTGIVWTVHNLRPHERERRGAEDLAIRSTLRNADRLVVHSSYAAERVTETYGAEPEVVPHGNFVGFYPPASRSRAETRRSLGVPDHAYVYLIFGQLRRYKRIPEAIHAFGELPDRNARLLVCGAPGDPALRAQIERAGAADPRVVLHLGHVPSERVAELHDAADCCVLPYRQVFSSGALLLALSLGLPAVAPAAGSAEIAGPPALVPFEEGALTAALAELPAVDAGERRRAARAAAARFDWGPIADRTLELYRGAAA